MAQVSAVVNKNTPLLIANQAHRNFVESGEVIPMGALVKGQPKLVNGLRKGKPFVYRLFYTSDNYLINLDDVTIEKEFELKSNADNMVSERVVKVPDAAANYQVMMFTSAIGGWIGYTHAKASGQNAINYVFLGVTAGLLVGFLLRQNEVEVKTGK